MNRAAGWREGQATARGEGLLLAMGQSPIPHYHAIERDSAGRRVCASPTFECGRARAIFNHGGTAPRRSIHPARTERASMCLLASWLPTSRAKLIGFTIPSFGCALRTKWESICPLTNRLPTSHAKLTSSPSPPFGSGIALRRSIARHAQSVRAFAI